MHRYQQTLCELLDRLHQRFGDRLHAVEVGVRTAETSRLILENCPYVERLTLVDVWELVEWRDDPLALKAEAFANVAPFAERIRWLHCRSVAAAKLIAGEGPAGEHLVFIDAHHGYRSVKADILGWGPLVVQGGVLCGHDYLRAPRRVRQAVDELFPGCEIQGGRVWVKWNE